MNIERSDFINWLNTKNPDEVFHFSNNCNCALAQYLRYKQPHFDISVGTAAFRLNYTRYNIPDWLCEHLHYEKPYGHNRTFGGLLERILESEL